MSESRFEFNVQLKQQKKHNKKTIRSSDILHRLLTMITRSFLFLLGIILVNFSNHLVSAQFGVGKKKPPKDPAPQEDYVSSDILITSESGLEFSDPELAEAIEMFANMSPEEMMDTMKELREMFSNDPQTLKEIEEVITELSNINIDDFGDQLRDLISEEELANSIAETMEILQNADDSDWNRILENKDAILEAVIATGAIDDEDIVEYKRNPDAWEQELRSIWAELKMQAMVAEWDPQAV